MDYNKIYAKLICKNIHFVLKYIYKKRKVGFMKERLDVLLVNRDWPPQGKRQKAMIMEGNVFVDGQREDKAGTNF